MLVYFQPVLLGLFAWIWLGEYMSPFKIMGLIIGFLGIVVVSVDGLTVHVSIIGVVLGLLMAFSWALGVVYVKKVSNEVDAFWMVSLQCIIGGAILIGTGTILKTGQLLNGMVNTFWTRIWLHFWHSTGIYHLL